MAISCSRIVSRLQKLDTFSRVRFILLFGSSAEGRATPDSDIDLAVSYDGPLEDASRFRIAAMEDLADNYDVRIFEQMPLYMRTQALKGRIVYCPDLDLLYEVAYRTIRDYEAFRHRLWDYIGEQAIT